MQIRFGAERIFQSKESTITDEDIDMILSKGKARTEEENEKIKAVCNTLETFTFNDTGGFQTFDGTDYSRQGRKAALQFIEPPKRERKVKCHVRRTCVGVPGRTTLWYLQVNYDVAQYYRERIYGGEGGPCPNRTTRSAFVTTCSVLGAVCARRLQTV